eukprot:COSAG02_NODE_2389_length_8985_cov_3.175676_6_plen_67_part_00
MFWTRGLGELSAYGPGGGRPCICVVVGASSARLRLAHGMVRSSSEAAIVIVTLRAHTPALSPMHAV